MAGFDSLYTGITGLNAYQSWIDLISNNIANVDTVGFKGQTMTFADLFYQNQGYASAPTNTSGGVDGQQLGYGVKVNTVDTDWGEGGLDTTGVNTDLAINGDGFFILNNLQGGAVPTYTRDGAFSLNENGVLYDPASGLAVQGWMANPSGQITGGATGNITIPVGLKEQATATGSGTKVGPSSSDSVFDVALGGNLDQTQWQQSFLQSIGAQALGGTPFTVSATMYDSLGNAHQATITYIPVTAGASAASVTSAGAANATGVSVAPATSIADTITITSNGTNYNVKDTATGVNMTVNAGSTTTVDGCSFTLATPATGAGSTETISVKAATSGLPSVAQNASGSDVTAASRWEVEVSFSDGTQFQTLTTPGEINAAGTVTTAPQWGVASSGVVGYAYFDKNGQFINSSSILGDNTDPPGTAYAINSDIHTNGSNPTLAQGNLLEVSVWGASAGNPAAAPASIGLSYGGSTSGGGLASLAGAYSANVLSQNGFAAGTLDNITIGNDGTITGAFTNGEQATLARVAVATFQNEDGLERVGDNQYEQSSNSGLAQVGVAGNGRYGAIQSGALEQSNVSLSTEFTNLIIAQRAFEANTRGITTADQNLQTIINLRASEN